MALANVISPPSMSDVYINSSLGDYKGSGISTVYGQLTRIDNMVTLSISWTATSSISGGATILTLPSGCRPKESNFGSHVVNTSGTTIVFGTATVASDGTVYDVTTSGSKIKGSINITFAV